MKVINLCTFLLCSILLVGCSSTRPPLTDDASTVTESYILGAGDTVNIMVYGEPEMTMKFIIDKSGAITFPYIGKLMLKGKRQSRWGKKLPRSYVGIICKTQWLPSASQNFVNSMSLEKLEIPMVMPMNPA